MLKGGGIALALPFLDGMSWAAPGKASLMNPKRMLVSYFSYGAYMPNGGNGIPDPNKPHHNWSWWPRRDVDCAAPAVKARVETALERIDMAIADSSFARTLPSVSGLSGSRGGVSQP